MLNFVRAVSVCAWALGAGLACAQNTVVLPNNAATTAGGGNAIPIGNFGSGVMQVVYAADQLSAVPAGSVITGIQLRLWNNASTNFPASVLALTKYDITLGKATVAPGSMSATYATNMTNPKLVLSGSFNLAANSYPGGAATGTTPEGWGALISFENPYVYEGGGLVVEFREDGPAPSTNFAADIVTSSGKLAYSTNGPSTATAGGSVLQNAGPAIRLTYLNAPAAPFQKGITRLMILDDLANVRGSSANFAPLNTNSGTNEYIAGAPEMRRLGLGSNFVGLFYRNSQGAAWPLGAQSFTEYNIQLARALTTPATMSSTIALNSGPDLTTVRSGALAIASGTFAGLGANPRPAPWTFEIPFTTPYTYTGGDLYTLVRQGGVSGGVAGACAGTLNSDPAFGTRVAARAMIGSSVATTTNQTLSYSAQLWSVDSGSVVPNANTTVRGATTVHGAPLASTPQTVQYLINASELTYIPMGSQITGLAWRSRSTSALPATEGVFTDYQVFVSSAARRPVNASATYATNEGADKVQVRSGPWVLGANSFAGSTTVNPFGPTLEFDRAFIYQGGDLCVTLRLTGMNASSITVDAQEDSSQTRSISTAGDMNATAGTVRAYGPVLRFAYNPSVIAPASMDNTPGNDGYSIFFTTGNVLQSVYAADQLRGLRIGSLITGMSMRQQSAFGGGLDWPPADTTINEFSVTISTSPVGPNAMSNTFASNIGADAIVVRSGPLLMPAKAFPYVSSATRPNENEWFIQFKEPFVYKGGPLSVTIRNDLQSPGIFMDVLRLTPTQAAGRWAVNGGINATVHDQGTLTGALLHRFVFVPKSYCPADLNNDGIVEDADFTIFLNAYNILDCADGTMPQGCPADFNFDRAVDDADFGLFLPAYNALVCP